MEWFDFGLYSYLAVIIGQNFFSSVENDQLKTIFTGNSPINNVENAIMIIVVVNTTFLPYLSPIIPKMIPPTGLSKNASFLVLSGISMVER